MKQLIDIIKESILDSDNELENRKIMPKIEIKSEEDSPVTQDDINDFTNYIMSYLLTDIPSLDKFLIKWETKKLGWACDIYIGNNQKYNDWVCQIGFADWFITDFDLAPDTSKSTYKYIRKVVDKLKQFKQQLREESKTNPILKKFRFGETFRLKKW